MIFKPFTRLIFAILCCLCAANQIHAQSIVGTVTDQTGPIPGATVSISDDTGTVTDADGKYQLKVAAGSYRVSIRFIGYKTKVLSVTVADGQSYQLNVLLEEQVALLNEMVVVGSRSEPRSAVDSPVPVDILPAKELMNSGQTTFDKALTYKVPSFNSVQTPVNDATSLLDPYEIRNMGPSRTLILINGKRKNLSALLYTQTSPGRGETGADISAIPTAAVKRVEILRDGASAHYGSDAIAGVMNIILKDATDGPSAILRTGITGKGDGETLGFTLNNGLSLNENGFLNYTMEMSKVNLANRPGTVNAIGEASDFGADIAVVEEFLSRRPDAGNINGAPETTSAKFLVNGGIDVNEDAQAYFNAAYVYKSVNSFANYRTPYWRTIADFPYLSDFFPAPGTPNSYDGYIPTFDGVLKDYNGTIGFRSSLDDWKYDVSFTVGGNEQTYRVRNSHNRNFVYSPSTWLDGNNNGLVDPGEITEGVNLYRENSPISFDPGGTRFNHVVGNIDISKPLSDDLFLAFGAEFRAENFDIIEGELASYDGGGADSFAGNRPENSGTFNRHNLGGYVELTWDLSTQFLISGTLRMEDYSDFGTATVWKLSSRYKFLNDQMVFRGSLSTGFRAPTLHQIYTQKAQYSFIPGQGIQVGGLINNVSPQANLLGIPQLKAEKSNNLTLGLAASTDFGVDITLDYYSIAVKDRIVLSTEIGATAAGNTPLDQVLQANNLSDVSFFVNAIDTRTSGIDLVVNKRNITMGDGVLNLNLLGNYTISNERDGLVNNPSLVENAGQSVVNSTQEALFFTSRPRTKWILGAVYDLERVEFSLNNTYFGKTEFRQQGLNAGLKTEFTPKVVTDISAEFEASEKLTFTLNVNNILNVLPEWNFVALNAEGQAILNDASRTLEQSNLITFNQRYSQMTYDGYHFSQLGTLYSLTVNLRF